MKKFLFAALMLALMGSAAFATDTRLETMGMGSFWYNGTYVPALNSVIKDDANISMYPSTINYYPNIFWGEIDSHEDYSSKSIYGDKDYFYKAGALFSWETRKILVYWVCIFRQSHMKIHLIIIFIIMIVTMKPTIG